MRWISSAGRRNSAYRPNDGKRMKNNGRKVMKQRDQKNKPEKDVPKETMQTVSNAYERQKETSPLHESVTAGTIQDNTSSIADNASGTTSPHSHTSKAIEEIKNQMNEKSKERYGHSDGNKVSRDKPIQNSPPGDMYSPRFRSQQNYFFGGLPSEYQQMDARDHMKGREHQRMDPRDQYRVDRREQYQLDPRDQYRMDGREQQRTNPRDQYRMDGREQQLMDSREGREQLHVDGRSGMPINPDFFSPHGKRRNGRFGNPAPKYLSYNQEYLPDMNNKYDSRDLNDHAMLSQSSSSASGSDVNTQVNPQFDAKIREEKRKGKPALARLKSNAEEFSDGRHKEAQTLPRVERNEKARFVDEEHRRRYNMDFRRDESCQQNPTQMKGESTGVELRSPKQKLVNEAFRSSMLWNGHTSLVPPSPTDIYQTMPPNRYPKRNQDFMTQLKSVSEEKSPIQNTREFKVSLDVNHYAPEEILVTLEDGKLIVNGKHFSESEYGFESCQFHRRYPIPDGIKKIDIKSSINEDGILIITGRVGPPEIKAKPNIKDRMSHYDNVDSPKSPPTRKLPPTPKSNSPANSNPSSPTSPKSPKSPKSPDTKRTSPEGSPSSPIKSEIAEKNARKQKMLNENDFNEFLEVDNYTYLLKVDCNGYTPDDMEVRISGRDLIVRARQKDGQERVRSKEFTKRFSIPRQADCNTITSKFTDNDILFVEVKKLKPRQ